MSLQVPNLVPIEGQPLSPIPPSNAEIAETIKTMQPVIFHLIRRTDELQGCIIELRDMISWLIEENKELRKNVRDAKDEIEAFRVIEHVASVAFDRANKAEVVANDLRDRLSSVPDQ